MFAREISNMVAFKAGDRFGVPRSGTRPCRAAAAHAGRQVPERRHRRTGGDAEAVGCHAGRHVGENRPGIPPGVKLNRHPKFNVLFIRFHRLNPKLDAHQYLRGYLDFFR